MSRRAVSMWLILLIVFMQLLGGMTFAAEEIPTNIEEPLDNSSEESKQDAPSVPVVVIEEPPLPIEPIVEPDVPESPQDPDPVPPVPPVPSLPSVPPVPVPEDVPVTIEAIQAPVSTDTSAVVTEKEMKEAGIEAVEDFFLVKYEDGSREIRKVDNHKVSALKASGQEAPEVDELIQEYDGKPDVEYAEPIAIYEVSEIEGSYVPRDTYYQENDAGLWGIKATRTDHVYGRIPDEKLNAVVVAVLDTGVDYTHPELVNEMLYERNTSTIMGYDFVNNDADPRDDYGHGTHVAGTIASESNNEGIIGIAEGVKIMPVKVLDGGGYGYTTDISNGIKWAADNGAHVINMSLGGTTSSQDMQDAVLYANQQGVTVVVAAGNNSDNDAEVRNPVNYPAACDGAIAVGALKLGADGKTRITYFSNSGPELDVVAPGQDILSTMRGGSYGVMSGTSMATPHVSALAALLKAQDGGRSPKAIESLIESTADSDFQCDPIYGENKEVYGAGLIDCASALGLEDSSDDPRLQAIVINEMDTEADPDLNFSPDKDYYICNVRNGVLQFLATGISSTQSAWIQKDNSPFEEMDRIHGKTINVLEGISHITIRSFSDNNQKYTDYVIEVRRGYAANSLMSMALYDPTLPWALKNSLLSPAFQPNVMKYSTTVLGNVSYLELVASAAYSNAEVTVNGEQYISGDIFTASLETGINNILVSVRDGLGSVREYALEIIKRGDIVSKFMTVPVGTQLNERIAPVLSLCEGTAGDFFEDQTFILSLSNSVWPEGSDRALEIAVPDVVEGGVAYTVQFFRFHDGSKLEVVLSDYHNNSGEAACLNIPLLVTVQKGMAHVTVKGMGSPIMNGTYAFAEGMSTYGETVTSEGRVKFDASGYADLKPITIEETVPYSISEGKPIDIRLATSGYVFETENARDVVSYQGAYIQNGDEAVTDYSLEDSRLNLVAPENRTDGTGKIVVKGLRIKGTPGAIIDNLQLEIGGKALCSQHRVDVAYGEATVIETTPPAGGGGGGGGGGGSGITVVVKVSEEMTANLDEFAVTLEPDTATSEFELEINKVTYSRSPFGSGNRQLSSVYTLTSNKEDPLQKEMEIQFQLKMNSFDTAKETAGIYYLDPKTNKWLPLKDVQVDAARGTLTGSTRLFTEFAAVASPAEVIVEEPVAQGAVSAPVVLTDISGHWAQAAIQRLIEVKAVSGNPDGTFQPEKHVTRGEFISMLVKCLEETGTTDRNFSDLNGHWASEAVRTAVANGVLNGFEDGTIRPEDPITRQQMAVMVYNAAKLAEGLPDRLPADEAQIAPWARSAVISAMKAGFISGYADGTFRPQALATKAEAVTILVRCLK